MLMEPQRLSITVPGANPPASAHTIVYWQWGDASKPAVVCVHGLTRNGRDFDFLARALAADFRVICPDMPGRGESQRLTDPNGYSYPSYVADILFMMSSLKLDKIRWVGTSMGGIIGMMLTNVKPGLITGLVINDIGCLIPAAGLKRIMGYAGSAPVFKTRAEAEAALRERCAPYGIKDEAHWQQLFAHSFHTNADGTLSFACDPAISATFPKAENVADIDLWSLWEGVSKVPVLLIRGAESDILPKAVAEQMKAQHKRLTLTEIAGSGHAPALMEAGQVTLIQDWLKSLR